ncbi:MAG TPA: tetratricopeptide repeat protein, partial [Chitinophagales bacterium]|nr:tetratricopeptide repeat protein [Chitinophagales bacterium]
QENADRQEELEIINAKAGGGSEFSLLELDEEGAPNETFELATESASVRQLESISTEEPLIPVRKEEKIIMEETSSLRFNETVTVPGAFLPGKSYSFLDWLKFFKPENSGGTAKKEEKVPEPVETGLPAVDKTEHSGPVKTGLTAELETIDRIVSTIRHEPSDKAELLFSPADLARKSIEMDDEMVTETLASIYEAQGLYDKAIRMYARLSLKFPEKSLFFAARIKELKSKK